MPESSPTEALPLERRDALLSWIQQFAPYGVLTLDEDLRVQSWNHWMELHSGLQTRDVAGKTIFSLYPTLAERRLHLHLERALQGESSVLSTSLHHYLIPLPSAFREAGLPEMLQTARIAPLFSQGRVCGIVVVIEDVTQREHQADALSRQHRRDELLSWALAHLWKTEQPRKAVRQLFFKIAEQLDFDTFLIYLRDVDTGLLSLNAAGGIPVELQDDFRHCPFLALVPPDLVNTTIMNSVQERDADRFAPLKKAGFRAAVAIPLVTNERNLGILCFATSTRESITPDEFDLVNKIAQYLAIALDRDNTNSQLVNAKAQLSEHARLLEKRVEERTSRLQETISELETFSYTIAHDLRAPARGMTGYCEALLEDHAAHLPPEASLMIQKIGRASRQMESLTRDLLEFSRVSRQEVMLDHVELEPLIEELLSLHPPQIRQAVTVVTPLLPVRGHQALLIHVLSNLIDNAMKFVRPGTATRITLMTESVPYASPNTRSRALIFSSTGPAPMPDSTEPSHGKVRIWVNDDGIGISPADHQKIFGIFERGVAAGPYAGTGIGLAIVARAMQRMGGTCGVDSAPGQGSRFWLELPACP